MSIGEMIGLEYIVINDVGSIIASKNPNVTMNFLNENFFLRKITDNGSCGKATVYLYSKGRVLSHCYKYQNDDRELRKVESNIVSKLAPNTKVVILENKQTKRNHVCYAKSGNCYLLMTNIKSNKGKNSNE